MSEGDKKARIRTLIETLGFIAFAILSKAALDPLMWRYAGPVSLTLTMVLLTLYLRHRQETWRDYGLIALPGIKAKLWVLPKALLTFFAFCAVLAPVLLLAPLLGITIFDQMPEGVEERWGDVRGNLGMLLLWLAIVWTSAAFFEEMFFRGFLVTQCIKLFGSSLAGKALAVLLPALLFGLVHMYYQGLRGLITAGLIGVAFGVMFLGLKRNLWPIILVHGMVDTIGFVSRYLGLE